MTGGDAMRAGLACLLDGSPEPLWMDVNAEALESVRATVASMARRIAELEREGEGDEVWLRIKRARCQTLQCGLIARCHRALAVPSKLDG